MPNVTEIKRALPFKFSLAPDLTLRGDEPPYALWGSIAGFIFYWLAFAVPILQFGANTLFFLLYTWPFFLALLPLCVLVGEVFSVLLGGKLWLTVLVNRPVGVLPVLASVHLSHGVVSTSVLPVR